MYVAFAPLQGYTDCVYRRAHNKCAGGVDEYYTPFVQLDNGTMRGKGMRDVAFERNSGVPTVPQVIAGDAAEFAALCDELQSQGWRRIDLNMGCPFPMQVRAGRGCGLLRQPDKVEAIAVEMQRRADVRFSIKMRLGWDSADECMALLPVINDMPLVHVTLHPRLGRQQYKGEPDLDAFCHFAACCPKPVVYNGDIVAVQQLDAVVSRFPALKGVMIGRGLLANPSMLSGGNLQETLAAIHAEVYRHAVQSLCGESQMLAFLRSFWDYVDIDRKKRKTIAKAGSLLRYNEAVAGIV